MRHYPPTLHPRIARYLGIRLMYAPPLRHVHHTPIRPLVVRSSLSFPGASLYFTELRRNLRRRFIMDVAQLLSFFPLIALFSLSMSWLIDDPRCYTPFCRWPGSPRLIESRTFLSKYGLKGFLKK